MSDRFMDILDCFAVAITIANYQENLQQSSNDDVIEQLNNKQNAIIERLQSDIDQQNKMLGEIIQRLEKIEHDDRRSICNSCKKTTSRDNAS